MAGYNGPHRLVLNRNPQNLGIGAHLSKLVDLCQGELLFVTAGDDVSLPQRCERCVEAWIAHGRRPDLIASALVDIDALGRQQGLVLPTDLGTYHGTADWLARPPFVVGAGQAWTRRLFDHFGPLPAGTVAEDLIMVFRAIVAGGAITVPEPLVLYRRGGLSARRRALHASEVRARLLGNARHSLVEMLCLLRDAKTAGVSDVVSPVLTSRLAREQHIAAQLSSPKLAAQLSRLIRDRLVPWPLRLRVFVYAACPMVLAPVFALKRALLRRSV